MKSSLQKASVLTLLLVFAAAAGLASPAEKPGWTLTFDDEFDGSDLDLNKWNPNDPSGWERNKELQAYVSDAFAVGGGFLRIKAEKAAGVLQRQTALDYLRHDDHPREIQPGIRAL